MKGSDIKLAQQGDTKELTDATDYKLVLRAVTVQAGFEFEKADHAKVVYAQSAHLSPEEIASLTATVKNQLVAMVEKRIKPA